MLHRRTLMAGGLAWLAFFAYLRWAVPLIEGQSADQVPRIDLLGSVRIEQPGQWLSLFPPDAWQRDDSNRNIIQADGNIVLFQSFQHEPNSALRVKRLTLLLFDQESGDDQVQSSVAVPLVIESLDDALLTFDAQHASGLNRYGDLKRVEFLGQVKFWRRSPQAEDSFALETEHLTVTGGQATTESQVRFQFGDSGGLATGLELTFENPESLHLANATLTKIAGLRHLRLSQVHHLDLRTRPETVPGSMPTSGLDRSNHVRLSCAGPAEFSFSHRSARFQDDVRVFDFGSRCWLTGRALYVKFEEQGISDAGGASQSGKAGLPEAMVARELRFFGAPAAIIDEQQAFQLTASTMTFQVENQEFLAGNLAVVGSEPWMQDAARGGPDGVEALRGNMLLRTPQLRYRLANEARHPGTSSSPAQGLGTVEASGPGQLWYAAEDQRPPMQLRWQERLTVAPDPDDSQRLLVSVLGGTAAAWDRQSSMLAQSLYFWLQRAPAIRTDVDPNEAATAEARWAPDLVLARGQVRFEGDKLRAAVREARVYFPPPRGPSQPSSATASPHMAANRAVGLSTDDLAASEVARIPGAPSVPAARAGSDRPASERLLEWGPPALLSPAPIIDRGNVGARGLSPEGASQRGADITAESLIVQLGWPIPSMAAAPSGMASGSARSADPESGTSEYRLQTIDLEGQVVVEERGWDAAANARVGESPSEPSPAYRMFGHRIVGIASENEPGPPSGPPEKAAAPEFTWSLTALPGQMARLDNQEFELLAPEVQFDQRQNIAWTNRPGTLSFLVPPDDSLALPTATAKPGPAAEVPLAAVVPRDVARTGTGQGTARWQNGFQFDGRQLLLDGQVEWEIERPKPLGQTERLRGLGDRLTIELSETLNLGADTGTSARPTAKRVRMTSAPELPATGEAAPVKLFMQQSSADENLIAHEVIWAEDVDLDLPRNTFHFRGPGSLWSVRAATAGDHRRAPQPNPAAELTYLKVQFQRAMEGQWSEGVVNLLGPVSALYGKATDWQILDHESRLLNPLRINSDTMSLNRWQPSPQSPVELDWEADGRVHVWGEQFEGTARRINYSQTQDQLLLRGDSRGPAKFWQTTPGTASKNHLAAQKIWYWPKQEDFRFEGFHEGNLGFFSGRRGDLDPPGGISGK